MVKTLALLSIALLFLCGCEKGPKIPCATEQTCLNDPNCVCWCSQICNFRKKTNKDHPVYVENDPNEKFCYCKQWDMDNYEDNCVLGKGIKEPKDAQ